MLKVKNKFITVISNVAFETSSHHEVSLRVWHYGVRSPPG
jgi:hypothetical protein